MSTPHSFNPSRVVDVPRSSVLFNEEDQQPAQSPTLTDWHPNGWFSDFTFEDSLLSQPLPPPLPPHEGNMPWNDRPALRIPQLPPTSHHLPPSHPVKIEQPSQSPSIIGSPSSTAFETASEQLSRSPDYGSSSLSKPAALSGSATRSRKVSPDRKRQNHIAAEKYRRDRIRDLYARLITLVSPEGSESKLPSRGRPRKNSLPETENGSKSSVLFRAVQYIDFLTQSLDILRTEVEQLEAVGGTEQHHVNPSENMMDWT